MRFLLLSLISWLALPAYVAQGLAVRMRSLRLGPGSGDPFGTIPGEGEPIRLLTLGDSSAGAIGIARQQDGLGPQLAHAIAKRSGRPVEHQAAGFNSAVARDIRDHVLPNLADQPWTHILIAVGVNDTKNYHTIKRWKLEFGGLLYGLRARFPTARIVWSPVPPMGASPVMPKLLGSILEMRATLINRKGRQLCLERGAAAAPRLTAISHDGFCRDGFHANEAGYEAWANHLVDTVLGSIENGPEQAEDEAQSPRSNRLAEAS